NRMKAILSKVWLFWIVKAIYIAAIRRPLQIVHEILFLGSCLSVAYGLDVLVICGGGQLLDWGGPWAFPYTIFKWVLLAKLGGVKCIFLNNGAGPLDHSLSRWFIRWALNRADYVSFRDPKSSNLIRQAGFKHGSRVVADCVWALDLHRCSAARGRNQH